MAKHSEQPLSEKTAALIQTMSRDGLKMLDLEESAPPKTIIAAIDAAVWVLQQGKKPSPDLIKHDMIHYALGSLWGIQLIRQFGWEWAMVMFNDEANSKAPAVVSPDRALVVYPIHSIRDGIGKPGTDAAIALSYNMLFQGKMGTTTPGNYRNVVTYARKMALQNPIV